MRGSFRLTRVFGIDIKIHVTFFLLLAFFALILGAKGLVLIIGIFFFVTVHELCHSLAAAHFGIKVKKITLLPIGGVASMQEVPKKPYQEMIISLAGPLSNLVIVAVFFYPLYLFLGRETLMYPFRVLTGQAEYTGGFNVWAHIYWINLVLAVFNLIPAFPMDGGRVLRAILTSRMGFKQATAVAVRLGHIFALMFAYLGIVYGHIFLLIIAVFIYMAASSEGLQVEVVETIKKYTIKDVLPRDYIHVDPETRLSKLLELMFHAHQEDFPVLDDGEYMGLITRKEILHGMHVKGKEITAQEIMRTDIEPVSVSERLHKARKLMIEQATNALPVVKNDQIVGVVTLDDINRVYVMVHDQTT
ncbi:MAG: CBS domain-containing protein [Candidatus Omnitrophica bacterium]|nr:CBS domain-containing protein [Candidatus Omnitrophota bacterium]